MVITNMIVAAATPPLLVIAGATASGKTKLAIAIAQRFDAEIISADSLQVYRHLNIGTAKPTLEEQKMARHHLIDCLEIDEDFSAARYASLAAQAIMDITARRKRIIVAGGAGLYIKALLYGLADVPAAESQRQHYRLLAKRFGTPYLHELLSAKDAAAAGKITPNDLPRIVRALESIEITGKSIVGIHALHRFAQPQYPALVLGIALPPEELFTKIEQRVEKMLQDGLLAETNAILARGYSPELKPLRAVGYKQIIAHLQGEISLAAAGEAIKRETKRYAKRQLNWFKTQQPLKWIAATDKEAFFASAAALWEKEP